MSAPAWDRADAAAVQAIAKQRFQAGGPIVVGLAGAQGSGKSTMARRLVPQLAERGLRCALLSLDDFYLPLAERLCLARSVHPLLATRGVPGTHDISLLVATIDALLSGEAVAPPRFDKAADDRLPPGAGERLVPPFDAILLEGWCVGALPQREDELATPINALERDEDSDGRWRRWVNLQLARDYAALFERLAVRILLRAPGFEVVARWRGEQEAELRRETGGAGMAEDELHRFVAHYERITRWMLADAPAELVIEVDADRIPVDLQICHPERTSTT